MTEIEGIFRAQAVLALKGLNFFCQGKSIYFYKVALLRETQKKPCLVIVQCVPVYGTFSHPKISFEPSTSPGKSPSSGPGVISPWRLRVIECSTQKELDRRGWLLCSYPFCLLVTCKLREALPGDAAAHCGPRLGCITPGLCWLCVSCISKGAAGFEEPERRSH